VIAFNSTGNGPMTPRGTVGGICPGRGMSSFLTPGRYSLVYETPSVPLHPGVHLFYTGLHNVTSS